MLLLLPRGGAVLWPQIADLLARPYLLRPPKKSPLSLAADDREMAARVISPWNLSATAVSLSMSFSSALPLCLLLVICYPIITFYWYFCVQIVQDSLIWLITDCAQYLPLIFASKRFEKISLGVRNSGYSHLRNGILRVCS